MKSAGNVIQEVLSVVNKRYGDDVAARSHIYY